MGSCGELGSSLQPHSPNAFALRQQISSNRENVETTSAPPRPTAGRCVEIRSLSRAHVAGGPIEPMSFLALLPNAVSALTVCGLDVPHARLSPISRALDGIANVPDEFPYTERDLKPKMDGGDGRFYFVPKFVQHAGDECRDSLTQFYSCVLPPSGTGTVLDLCSSWTSHYPKDWQGARCVALGLNYAELAVNPSKTEYKVQDLNDNPTLPFDDATFDVITNSLSVDYMTSPLALFKEMHRVLKPGGYACMAFTNRCFPTKVVPIWTKPFTEVHHAQIVGNYYKYSAEWAGGIEVADVCPDGWVGQRDPMVVIVGRKGGGSE